MSVKIEQLLEVIVAVSRLHKSAQHASVSELRVLAVKNIARQRGIEYQTVGDKYIRNLSGMHSTAEFDELLADFLSGGNQLEVMLNLNVLEHSDLGLIEQTFRNLRA